MITFSVFLVVMKQSKVKVTLATRSLNLAHLSQKFIFVANLKVLCRLFCKSMLPWMRKWFAATNLIPSHFLGKVQSVGNKAFLIYLIYFGMCICLPSSWPQISFVILERSDFYETAVTAGATGRDEPRGILFWNDYRTRKLYSICYSVCFNLSKWSTH